MVKEELRHGAEGYANRDTRLAQLEELFSRHGSVAFDDAAAAIAGKLCYDLEKRGEVMGPHDIQIASNALHRGWTLVTANWREFSRVEGLAVEDRTKNERAG